MSNISDTFNKGKALITFVMAGDPSLSATEKLVLDLERSGADIIEIGVPFSDSVADGLVIVEAANRAIEKNVSAGDVIRLVGRIRERSDVPVILMTSYNIIFAYGVDRFLNDAAKVAVDGLILPDLSLEESKLLSVKAEQKNIDLIFLVAPNTPDERIKEICGISKGFIYLVSTTGTTGVRKELSSTIKDSVSRIRQYTDKPVAVGFGISTPEQAKQAAKYADGVIVGSAIVKSNKEYPQKVRGFVKRLKKAIS